MNIRRTWKSVVLAIFAALAIATPALADPPPQFGYAIVNGWSAGTGIPRGWQTTSCSGHFTLILFRDSDYGGMHTRVCRNEPTLCHVPMEPYATPDQGWCVGFATDWFNDHASSWKLTYLQPHWCLYIYEDQDYQRGAGHRYRQIVGNEASVGTFSDIGSSIEAYYTASGTCA